MLFTAASKRFTALACLSALAFLVTGTAQAQSSGRGRPRVFQPSNPEDDRNPVVFQRNLIGLADRAVSLGTQIGLAPESIQQFADLRRQLDTFGAPEFAAAAQQLGDQIGRANRSMARIVIVPGPGNAEPEPVPLSGSTWAFNPSNVVIAPYPAFDFAVDDTASGSGSTNTSSKVCSNHLNTGCSVDDDCPTGDTCIDRPTNANESQPIQIFRGCAARPSDTTIRDLAIASAVFEGIQMVADRICGQEWFGFNINLVCIITDLLFLINRSFLDFEVMCADRWSDAENSAAYDRLGHLHGDIDGFKSSVDNYFTSTTGPVFLLQQSVNNHFTDTTNQLNSFETNVNNKFGDTNTNIDNTRTTTNTNIDNTRTVIQTQLTGQTDLFLRAEIERALLHKERLAMYYLPEAQGGQLGLIRQIVEQTILHVTQSGESAFAAQQSLQQAITDVNARRFKRAFNYFSVAYFEAIKILGESQTY